MPKIGPFSPPNFHPKENNIIHRLRAVELEKSAQMVVSRVCRRSPAIHNQFGNKVPRTKREKVKEMLVPCTPGLAGVRAPPWEAKGTSYHGAGCLEGYLRWLGHPALRYSLVGWCIKTQLGAEEELLPFSRERWHFCTGNPKCFAILILLMKHLSHAVTRLWPKGWLYSSVCVLPGSQAASDSLGESIYIRPGRSPTRCRLQINQDCDWICALEKTEGSGYQCLNS